MIKSKKTVQQGTSIDIIARTVGAYFLQGGFIFRYMGAVPAALMVLFTWTTKEILNRYMIDAYYYTGTDQISKLIEVLFSKKASIAIDIISEITSVGSLTSYQIIISSQIQIILERIKLNFKFPLKLLILPLQSLILIFPLTLLKNSYQIHYITPILVVCIVLLSSAVMFLFIRSFFYNEQICDYYMESNPKFKLFNDYQLFPKKSALQQLIEFFKYFPIFVQMFSGSALTVNYKRIEGPIQMKRDLIKKAVSVSLFFVILAYSMISYSVSFSFGQHTQQNIFTTFKYCNLEYFDLLALVFSFVLIFSYSNTLQSSRSTLMQLLNKNQYDNYGFYILLGLVFILISLIFAFRYENIITICGLFSAPTNFIYQFLIPIMCVYKLPYFKRDSKLLNLMDQLEQDPYPDSFLVALVKLLEISHSSAILKKSKLKSKPTDQLILNDLNRITTDNYYQTYLNHKFNKYYYKNEYKIQFMKLRKSLCIMMCTLFAISCSIAFVFNLKDFVTNK